MFKHADIQTGFAWMIWEHEKFINWFMSSVVVQFFFVLSCIFISICVTGLLVVCRLPGMYSPADTTLPRTGPTLRCPWGRLHWANWMHGSHVYTCSDCFLWAEHVHLLLTHLMIEGCPSIWKFTPQKRLKNQCFPSKCRQQFVGHRRVAATKPFRGLGCRWQLLLLWSEA